MKLLADGEQQQQQEGSDRSPVKAPDGGSRQHSRTTSSPLKQRTGSPAKPTAPSPSKRPWDRLFNIEYNA